RRTLLSSNLRGQRPFRPGDAAPTQRRCGCAPRDTGWPRWGARPRRGTGAPMKGVQQTQWKPSYKGFSAGGSWGQSGKGSSGGSDSAKGASSGKGSWGGGGGCGGCGGWGGGWGEKGDSKGWGKGGWGWGGGKGRKYPSGPTLSRARVTNEPVTGEVTEWKGKYGWIRPTVPVEHPQASRRQGLIYVSMSDLQGGLEALTVGSLCQFHVFCDASGLGAEEVIGS
ncbi:Uncharacterized protein SCF082_LOCUS23342, partial [Durusdinium trenchii]